MAKKKKCPAEAIANKYIADVLSGKIIACEFTRLACQRHLNDLKNGHKRGLVFDAAAAQRVIDFKSHLKHSKGKWAGQPLILEPWQVFINWCIFGWKNKDGSRRFRTVYEEIARKNGKSTEIAATGLYGLGFDGEGGAEIYSVATKEEQARITFNEGVRMTRKSGMLGGVAKIYTKAIVIDSVDSTWKPLGKDSKYQDGLNPHMTLVDEYHAHPDSSMLDVMDSALGSRVNPLILIITTAGFNMQSACYMERNYAINVLRGIVEDDTYFAIIFTLDKDDDWKDEDVWIKSNPNLGISVRIDDMQRMKKKAIESPAALNNFLTKKLNIWTSQQVKFFNMEMWDACDAVVKESELAGKKCFLAADLASKNDIAAVVGVFEFDDKYVILPKFFCPENGARKRSREDRVPYLAWAETGDLVLTPGDRIDYEIIQAEIKRFYDTYNVVKFGFDQWNFEMLRQRLVKEGMDERNIYEYPQTLKMMSEPTKELEVLVAEKRLVHNNHPVLRWMAGNTAVYTDPNENIRPVKNKSSEKIDGIVATIMGLGMEMVERDNKSVYSEERGLLIF